MMYKKDKIYVALMSVLLLVSLVGCCIPKANACEVTAEVPAQVVEVTAECAVFADWQGETWVWELENGEDYSMNELVLIQFNDMDTAELYDDEIVMIVRGG